MSAKISHENSVAKTHGETVGENLANIEAVNADPVHEAHSPLSQFEIKKFVDLHIGSFDISITNSSLYMIIATLTAILFFHFATRKKSLIPSRLQVMAESIHSFVADMLRGAVGEEGMKFFPFVFTLLMFILLCNLFGMTPYSFTATSQIAVTLSLALVSFTLVTVFAIYRNGLGGFFHMFLPSGVPIWMAPAIFLIEFFSFLIRPITLSVRLFANMVAGHVLLKVIAGFVISLGVIFGTLPFLFSVIMMGFETFVAVLQAYIFAILVCAYLGDAVREH